jgi:hypothetical protein
MRRHPRTTRFLAPALALGLVAAAAACSPKDDGVDEVGAPELQLIAGLQPIDGCDALLERLQTEALERVGPYGFGAGGPMIMEDFGATTGTVVDAEVAAGDSADESTAAPAPQTPPTTAATDPTDVSGTNVQEAGVDEPDIVKADGERILAVAGGALHWIDVTGDEPVDAGSVTLPEGFGQQLLVAGDKALVLVTGDGAPMPFEGDVLTDTFAPTGPTSTTSLVQVDLSSPEAMIVTNTLEVEGSILDARLVDSTARVVVTSAPESLNFVYPSNSNPEAADIAEEANRRVIEESELEDWIPAYRHIADAPGADEAVVDEGPLVECDRMSTPVEFSGFGTLSVLTVDVAGELGVGDAVGILASGENVYASADHLYVATTNYPVSEEESDPTDDFPEPPPPPTTAIHRFSIAGDGPADYERSGEVRGRLLDQFSMSELPGPEGQDLLRVATTDDIAQESFVTVLRDGGGEMLPIGEVGGLGEGEQIYSVRFVGDVGYVVTFRQTDPLYTIDLSDPTAPTVAGELELLGYSAYLHPIGDDLLLGIGQDATAEGQTTGTQLSLFDVSDPANPTRLQQAAIPGASSAAEYDHHAFLYWPETGLAVLPIQSYGGDVFSCPPDATCAAPESFNGAIGFHVATDGIDEVGRISHDDGSALARSVVVGDTLYTLSESSLVASDLTTLAPESALAL